MATSRDHREIAAGAALILGGAVLAALAVAFVRPDAPSDTTPDGRVVLRFTAWGGKQETQELAARVVDRVNASASEYFVKLEPVPSDYPTKLATMIAGGHAPDIFYLDLTYLGHYAALGALMDITERVETDSSPACSVDDYYKEVLQNYYADGRLYGLPWIAQPVVLYCNLEMFQRAGLALPNDTWDWERFATAARLLGARNSDAQTRRWGFVMEYGWPPLEMFVWQAGGELLSAEGHVGLADNEALAAAEFLQKLVRDPEATPSIDIVMERGMSNLFRDGRVAMFAGGAADDLDRLEGLPVAVREVPHGPKGERATFAWNAGLHISATTKHPRLAFDAYAALLDAIQHWKIAPPRKSLAALIEKIEPRKADAADVIRRSMEYMRPIRATRNRAEWNSLLGREFKQPLLRGDASAAELARELAPQLEEVVK